MTFKLVLEFNHSQRIEIKGIIKNTTIGNSIISEEFQTIKNTQITNYKYNDNAMLAFLVKLWFVKN